MADPDKAASLKRMKTLATGLLVVVTLLFVVARREGWPWLAAFAEAAMIGALADWFAVVALFRHPLGLPIPHTAILPRNKARLADNVARFIRDRFLDTASLVARLRAADPASRIGQWLQRLYADTPQLRERRQRLQMAADAPLTPALPLAGSTLSELQRLKQGAAP